MPRFFTTISKSRIQCRYLLTADAISHTHRFIPKFIIFTHNRQLMNELSIHLQTYWTFHDIVSFLYCELATQPKIFGIDATLMPFFGKSTWRTNNSSHDFFVVWKLIQNSAGFLNTYVSRTSQTWITTFVWQWCTVRRPITTCNKSLLRCRTKAPAIGSRHNFQKNTPIVL